MTSYIKKLLVSLIFILTSIQASFAYQGCASSREINAINIGALKNTLMVAALSCGYKNNYNAFIQKNNSQLSENGKIVKSYFRRVYGNDSEYYLNKFVTSIANNSSRNSVTVSSTPYCQQILQIFSDSMNATNNDLARYASQEYFTSLHEIKSCGGRSQTASR